MDKTVSLPGIAQPAVNAIRALTVFSDVYGVAVFENVTVSTPVGKVTPFTPAVKTYSVELDEDAVPFKLILKSAADNE